MAEFGNFPITHRPGKTNIVADALSRLYTVVDASVDLVQAIQDAYEGDVLAQAVLRRPVPEANTTYKLVAGLICHESATGLKLYVPVAVRPLILEEAHDSTLGGHYGAARTQELVERSYAWPSLAKDVQQYCQACEICQRDKPSNQRTPGLLSPLPIPHRPWLEVALDFMVELPVAEGGYNALMVVCCRFSKMIHLIKTTTTVTAPEVARLFFDNVVRLHGIPITITSDRDPKFT